MIRLVDWMKRCVTRRFLILFELGTMGVVGVAIGLALR